MTPNAIFSLATVSLMTVSILGCNKGRSEIGQPLISTQKKVESWITISHGRAIDDFTHHRGILIVRQAHGPGFVVPVFSMDDDKSSCFPIPYILVFDFDDSMCLLTDFDVWPAGNNPMAFSTGGRFAWHGIKGEFWLALESDGDELIESIHWLKSDDAINQELDPKQGRVFRITLSNDLQSFELRQMNLPLLDENSVKWIFGMDGRSEETRKRMNEWWKKVRENEYLESQK